MCCLSIGEVKLLPETDESNEVNYMTSSSVHRALPWRRFSMSYGQWSAIGTSLFFPRRVSRRDSSWQKWQVSGEMRKRLAVAGHYNWRSVTGFQLTFKAWPCYLRCRPLASLHASHQCLCQHYLLYCFFRFGDKGYIFRVLDQTVHTTCSILKRKTAIWEHLLTLLDLDQ